MNSKSQIDVNISFDRYDQCLLEGFSRDLNSIAEKWYLRTKTTSFTVFEDKIEVTFVYDRYKCRSLKGFISDLDSLVEKWHQRTNLMVLYTKST